MYHVFANKIIPKVYNLTLVILVLCFFMMSINMKSGIAEEFCALGSPMCFDEKVCTREFF